MIRGLLVWSNPDSTRDLNTASVLINKGIYQGGTLTFSGSSLAVTVAPFIAKSHDGMTVVSDANETVFLTAGTTQYIILFAKYGIPTATLELQVVSETTWTSSVNRDSFITLAKCVTPALAVAANTADVTYEDADYGDKLGQSPWRATVANFASLPLTGNHAGDVRMTLDTLGLYTWDEVTQLWNPIGMATNLTEDASRNTLQEEVENFALSTSGLIGGVLDDPNDHRGVENFPGVGIKLVETGSPNQLGVGAVHAYVHGNFIKQRAQTIALPAAADRYDLIYLEVWQETLPTALGLEYLNSSGSLQTLTSVVQAFNTCLEADLGPNQRIEQIGLYDNDTLLITKSAIRVSQNVPSSTIATPSTGMTATNNQFGNPYTNITTFDRFAYVASAPSVLSQRTWAIPLLVLKRRAAEGNFTVFAGDNRYAFDIAPRATIGRALTETLHTASVDLTEGELIANKTRPSGFLTTTPLFSGTYVGFFESIIRVKGHELILPTTFASVLAAPATGGRRDVFYVELHCTHSRPNLTTSTAMGGSAVSLMTERGIREFTWYGIVKSANVGSATDEADSMAALGYSPVSNDVALWQRNSTADEPTRNGLVYALPIAILHRRNTGAWNISTNPNGSTGRPDNSALSNANLIDPRELVDLRRTIIRARSVQGAIESSFDQLLDGTLRTRLQQHPMSSDVWGTTCLMTTLTSAAPVSGKHVITPVPSASNAHSVWSDSEELIPLTYNLANTGAAAISADGVFNWNGAGDSGTMVITAPAGMYLLPSGSITTDNHLVGPYCQQYSDPSTAQSVNSGCSFAFEIIASNNTSSVPQMSVISPATTVNTTDAQGRATQVTVTSSNWLSTGTAMMWTVWAVKPAASLAAAYSTNGCLFGSPLRSYSATHGGSPIRVGAIKATVTKVVTGTSFTITQADVLAAFPGLASSAAQVNIYGVADIKATSYKGLANLRNVALTNAGATDVGLALMTVTLATAAPANTNFSVDVMCDGNLINQWVEIVPETRQIRGLYSYALSTAAWNNTGGAGWSAPWVTTGTAGGHQRGASLADTSAGVKVGVMCGRVSAFNNVTAQPNKPFQVDYCLGGSFPSTANGYSFFYDQTQATALGFLSAFTIGFRPRVLSSATDVLLPNNSPYANWMWAGAQNGSASPALAMVGVVERAPTLALELVYEIPAYQGMQTSAMLRSKLRGTIPYVGDSLVTTEGYNGSFHGRYMADGPMYAAFPSAGAGTTLDKYAMAASRYRPVSATAVASPSLRGTGEVSNQVYNRSRRRVSIMRQVPYPPAPTASAWEGFAHPATLHHSAVATDEITSRQVEYVDISTITRNDRSISLSGSVYTELPSPGVIRQDFDGPNDMQIRIDPSLNTPILAAAGFIQGDGTLTTPNYRINNVVHSTGLYSVFLPATTGSLPSGYRRIVNVSIENDTIGANTELSSVVNVSGNVLVQVQITDAGVLTDLGFHITVWDIPVQNQAFVDASSRYYAAINIPAGAVLENVTLIGYTSSSTTIITALNVLNQENNAGGVQVVGNSNVTVNGAFTTSVTGAVGVPFQTSISTANNVLSYSTQAVGKNQSFYLMVQSDVSCVLKAIRYTYTKSNVSVDRYFTVGSNTSVINTSGVDEMYYAFSETVPSSRLPRTGLSQYSTIVDIPGSWDSSIENAMESSVFTLGASDASGDWARGQCARYDNGTGTTIYETNMLGFVPYSGTKLQENLGSNPAYPSLTNTLPAKGVEKYKLVALAGMPSTVGGGVGVASITPTAVINFRRELTLGISTGCNLKTQGAVSVPVGGSTVDGFWPVGRPVVEPD